MRFTRNVAVALAALAFGAAPAVAIASGGGNSKNAPGHNKTTSSTSSTSSTSNTKAYGRMCAAKGESKKHSSTDPTGKTAYAQCVVALAQANKNSHMTAKAACAGLSKKHVKGTPKTKGTPFSECISAVEKMRHGHTS